jgi:hypothetical protein
MLVEINKGKTEEREYIQITFDGRQQFYVEEDKVDWTANTLAKGFSNCHMIKTMLEQVYMLGQEGEDIEFHVNII